MIKIDKEYLERRRSEWLERVESASHLALAQLYRDMAERYTKELDDLARGGKPD